MKKQERLTLVIGHHVDRQVWLVVLGPFVDGEHHLRPARAVVEELVNVERDQPDGVAERHDVLANELANLACVNEPAQRLH